MKGGGLTLLGKLLPGSIIIFPAGCSFLVKFSEMVGEWIWVHKLLIISYNLIPSQHEMKIIVITKC